MAGYFRDFIKDFAEITAPLRNLTKDLVSEPFVLSEQEQNAVNQLKKKSVNTQFFSFHFLVCHSL